MFLTDTWTLAKQRTRHITYVFAGDAEHMALPADTEIFIPRWLGSASDRRASSVFVLASLSC
jgi:hypothetical protein